MNLTKLNDDDPAIVRELAAGLLPEEEEEVRTIVKRGHLREGFPKNPLRLSYYFQRQGTSITAAALTTRGRLVGMACAKYNPEDKEGNGFDALAGRRRALHRLLTDPPTKAEVVAAGHRMTW